MDYSGDPGSQDLEILELIELRTLGHLRYFGGLARQVEIALKTSKKRLAQARISQKVYLEPKWLRCLLDL